MWYFAFLAIMATANCLKFETVFSWKDVDIQFPNKVTRNAYIDKQAYIPRNNVPSGLAIWKDRIFLTLPRWRKGVASNLNYINFNENNFTNAISPELIPYPNLGANDVSNLLEDTIMSIIRPRIDVCDRLWGLDTGVEGFDNDRQQIRPPRLIVINLNTDKIIRTYTLQDSDKKANSVFASIVIDVEENCGNAYAYIFDTSESGLVVYSWATNNSWRIEHDFFQFDPIYGNYDVAGQRFRWPAGVFGAALSKAEEDGSKTLYFQAMSGIEVFAVRNRVLQNETLVRTDNYHHFKHVGRKGPFTQGTTFGLDTRTGIAYFTQIVKHGVACWNTNNTLSPNSFIFIPNGDDSLIFPEDLAISSRLNLLFILTSNLIKYVTDSPESQEDNHKITVVSLEQLSKYCPFDEYKTFSMDYE